jgi:ketosteroid isomerase-like protein
MTREASVPDEGTDLIELERQFGQAIIRADSEALERIVSDDWILVGPEGKVIPKAVFVAVLKSGELTHSAMDLTEPRVRVYGDTAIVTGRVTAMGTYQGQSFNTIERSTDVFVRQQGHWKCVLTQLTSIPEVSGHPTTR